jgi:GNAT superfamily N-acetyltransferase
MTISIHTATDDDIADLYRIAEDMEHRHEKNYFERCLAEQKDNKRIIYIATQVGRAVAYVQLVWTPSYATFKRLGIPEIQDLNVIPEARSNGIGSLLVDKCEAMAREANRTEMGISVGLNQSYGPAQRLYVKKGYVPDGAGICCDDVPVRPGELRMTIWNHPLSFDSLLTLKMVKLL